MSGFFASTLLDPECGSVLAFVLILEEGVLMLGGGGMGGSLNVGFFLVFAGVAGHADLGVGNFRAQSLCWAAAQRVFSRSSITQLLSSDLSI